MRARRYGESALLLLFLAGTVILDLVAASRTWEYPVFRIRDTAKAQFELCLWRTALAAAVSAVSAAAICVRGRAGRRVGAAAAATVILLLLFCRFAAPGQRRFWYEAQQLAGGTYPLICCCFLKRTEGKIRARTAGVLCFLLGVGSALLCGYSFTYGRIYVSPVTAFQMSAVSVAAYAAVYRPKQSAGATGAIGGVFAMALTLSAGRVADILNGRLPDWLACRANVLRAVFTGTYTARLVDVPARNLLPSFHLIWLGHAFPGTCCQAVYLILSLAFMAVLSHMLYERRRAEQADKGLAGVCGRRCAEQAGEGPAGVCGRERAEQAGEGSAGVYGRERAEQAGKGTAGVCGRRRAEQAGEGPAGASDRERAERAGEGSAGVCGWERAEQAGEGPAGAYVEALAAGVLLCCAVGLIAEINLLYGGDAGIMAGRNPYQIIPTVCLAALNALGAQTSGIKGSGTCIETTDAAGCKARPGREEIYE